MIRQRDTATAIQRFVGDRRQASSRPHRALEIANRSFTLMVGDYGNIEVGARQERTL